MSVAVGLVVNGLTTYGFLTVAKNALGDAEYDPLAALWGLVFILGPGFFQPLEQEVSRATAFRAATGLGSAPVLRKANEIGLSFLAFVSIAGLVAWPLGLDDLLDGESLLLAGLIVSLVAFAVSFPLRGLLAGRNEFGRYSLFFGVEGGVRFGGAVLLAVMAAGVGPYGLVVGLAPILAALVAITGKRPLARPGPPASLAEVSESLGWLLAASIFTNGLLNAGPVVVKALADADEVGAAGAFLNGLIIARIPLFFYQAVQASLLPQLAGLVGSGDHDEFRRVLYRLVAAVVAIGTVGVVGAALVGPVVVEVVFDDDLSSRDMALLAGAAAVFMLAMSFAQALIAMRRQARVALGWLIGVIAFAVVVAAGSDLFLRVELGLLAGAGAASVAMFVLLPSRPAARPEPAEAPVQPSPSI